MKKVLRAFVTLIIGAVAGCCSMLLLEYFSNGGSVEEFKEYVKGDKESVAKYVANADKNLKVTGFIRLEKGEGIEKKEEDYAAEVAKLAGQN